MQENLSHVLSLFRRVASYVQFVNISFIFWETHICLVNPPSFLVFRHSVFGNTMFC
jgi:hypothetical protein